MPQSPLSTSLVTSLADATHAERQLFYMNMTPEQADALLWDWKFWGRPDQQEPPGEWSIWLCMAGRGYGKTRTGSEWTRECVTGDTPLGKAQYGRVALVGETAADVRDVMIQGPSGILATSPPDFRPVYLKSERSLKWPNGAVALAFSAEDPDQLRGPEHDLSWSDEVGKWRYSQEVWDQLQFGMRVGPKPRQLVTTTPRPIPIIRDLLKREGKDVHVTRGRTYDNVNNLPGAFLQQMKDRYEGTRLGRQELEAEVLDDVPGALWTRSMLERRHPDHNPIGALMRADERLPNMRRVVVGVDPSGTSGEEDDAGDDVGIVVVGLGADDVFYVMDDCTVNLGPSGWGRAVVNAYRTHAADLIVGETNYGGAMVEFTVRAVDRNVPYKRVTASRGKVVRAEPVAALYEQGRIRHLQQFAGLEDQLCGFTRTGYLGKGSPDRADAMVWAVTELLTDQGFSWAALA